MVYKTDGHGDVLSKAGNPFRDSPTVKAALQDGTTVTGQSMTVSSSSPAVQASTVDPHAQAGMRGR